MVYHDDKGQPQSRNRRGRPGLQHGRDAGRC